LTRKLKEYYPHQSADSKNYADLRLQVVASATAQQCIGRQRSLTATTWLPFYGHASWLSARCPPAFYCHP